MFFLFSHIKNIRKFLNLNWLYNNRIFYFHKQWNLSTLDTDYTCMLWERKSCKLLIQNVPYQLLTLFCLDRYWFNIDRSLSSALPVFTNLFRQISQFCLEKSHIFCFTERHKNINNLIFGYHNIWPIYQHNKKSKYKHIKVHFIDTM